MTPPRLLLVTRRFWPLVGGAERAMASLAGAFREAGAEVTLLTACWQPEWPRQIVHQGIRVERLPHPGRRVLGTWRYLQALSRAVAARQGEFDLVYVSQLREDAFAVLGAARAARLPVVVRASGVGPRGDVAWQRSSLAARCLRRRLRQAEAVVATSQASKAELLAAGYRAERICYVPPGVTLPAPRTPAARQVARRELGQINPLLVVDAEVPVALYTGRLDAAKGLGELVAAWSLVAQRRPDARLWIVGEGPFRRALAEQIMERGLEGRVVLAGAFDAVDDFLAAADLFVLPSREENVSMSLIEAMAAGLPVVASRSDAHRSILLDGEEGELIAMDDPAAWARALLRLFDEPDLAASRGALARARAERDYALADAAGAHLALFDRLIRGRQPQDSSGVSVP